MKGSAERPAVRYMNPYLAGVLLGVVMLVSFLILGTGLGASGGVARIAAFVELQLFRSHVEGSGYFGRWGADPLRYYLVFMFVGIFLGGLVSAILARRIRITLEKGATCTARRRIALALLGGVIVGAASRLARGCTSGQALTGSALLLAGSIVFLIALFCGGYAAAGLVKGQWRD